ncbi:hypothetical protein [Streptomyces sp. NPDC050263]|uniref:hypothetical protein n=1 Tax=Streptomyces sp. NPDC050263 TaxID=3155037 RepID=UPI003418B69B
MSTNSGGVLRLPGSAIPDGCPSWDGERAGRWTRALPPAWVPVRARFSVSAALSLLAVPGAGLLSANAALPAWGAALLALHLVWLVLRPEAAAVLAPAALVVVLALGDLHRGLRLGLAAVFVGVWATVWLRLVARRRQRAEGLAAAGGVTAVVSGAMFGRAERGTFLLWSGLVTVVAGGVLYASADLWGGADDRQATPGAAWGLAGLGLTLLVSGALGRRRALALRGAPVPVLRVLLRENSDVDTEVFAADDIAALRPLFTVATSELDDSADDDEDDEGEDEDGDDDDDDDELRELIERLDAGLAGPLREGVMYGVPYDGAEIVFVAASDEAGEPPVVEASVGPVRPMTAGAIRRRVREEKSRAGHEAHDEALRRAAATAVAEEAGPGAPVEVRRWRAGWADRFAAVVGVLYAVTVWESGWWGLVYGLALTLLAALLLPRRLAWRITADREGLWFNGFRETRHIAWDHLRVVRCEGFQLRIDSRRASFDEWTVASPRWRWLERRLGRPHPYERTAAEITAMWRDPALRPVGVGDERQRGRVLWPLGVVIGAVGAAAVFLMA